MPGEERPSFGRRFIKMKILSIDSSGLVASAAIVEDSVLIAEYTLNYKKTHSQTLLPMLEEIRKMTELDLDTVDAIAVSKGPGSFTGLRIGSATAKGLGLALNKPIIPVSTLTALSYNAYGYSGLVCPVMDARRMQVYTGIYRYDRSEDENPEFSEGEIFGKEPEVILSDRALAVEELIGIINDLPFEGRIMFLGDGVSVYSNRIKELIKKPFEFAPAHMARQRAGALAALAGLYYKRGVFESSAEHRPEYLRLSQAERERLEKLKRDEADILIRNMTPQDADEVTAIEERTFSMPWKKKDFLEMIERDNMTCLVVEKDGKLIGIAGIRQFLGVVEITNVAILEEYRKRGYGKRLISRVLEEGERLGGKEFTLEVRKSNTAALRLYEGAGFKREGERKNFYEAPREDALILWKRS